MPNDQQAELHLILGCFGRIDDGFISCRGCENKILLVGPNLENYNKIMDFLDSCRMFDKPAFDFNSIRNILYNMSENFDQVASGRRLWNQKQIDLQQKFLLNHKLCGTYLKLALISNEDNGIIDIEEKTVPIEAISKQISKVEAPKINLKLIRGRGRT